MSNRRIVLRLDKRWYDALKRHFKDETLQDRLESFLKQEAQHEAERRFSVFRVVERGEQSCFLVEQPIDLLAAARSMRHYNRKEGHGSDFRHYYATATDIPPDTFDSYAQERQENTGRVVGAFDIDLDAGTFSALSITDGWHTFTVRDVVTAAYHADLRNGESPDERTGRLLDHLSGRELTTQEQAAPGMGMTPTMC